MWTLSKNTYCSIKASSMKILLISYMSYRYFVAEEQGKLHRVLNI